MKKLFAKIFTALFSWEDIVKIFLSILFKLASSWQKELQLKTKQKMLIRILAALNQELGVKWSSETPTDVDDVFVSNVISLTESLAEEHGFKLYTITPLK